MRQSRKNKIPPAPHTNIKQISPAPTQKQRESRFPRIFRGHTDVVGEKMRSGVSVSVVVKYIVYSVVMLIFLMLQTTFFTRLRPFGSTPDILIVAVACVGMFEGGRAGAIFGVAAGYAADALGSTGIMILPLFYMLAGYICGQTAADYYRRSVLLFLIFDGGVCVLRAFVTMLYVTLTWHSFVIGDVIKGVILPEFFSTAVCSPFPALCLLPVYLIFRRHEREEEQL